MTNMDYCRFYNTLDDLIDCQTALEDGALHKTDEMQPDENSAMNKLIRVCFDIASEFGYDEWFDYKT